MCALAASTAPVGAAAVSAAAVGNAAVSVSAVRDAVHARFMQLALGHGVCVGLSDAHSCWQASSRDVAVCFCIDMAGFSWQAGPYAVQHGRSSQACFCCKIKTLLLYKHAVLQIQLIVTGSCRRMGCRQGQAGRANFGLSTATSQIGDLTTSRHECDGLQRACPLGTGQYEPSAPAQPVCLRSCSLLQAILHCPVVWQRAGQGGAAQGLPAGVYTALVRWKALPSLKSWSSAELIRGEKCSTKERKLHVLTGITFATSEQLAGGSASAGEQLLTNETH